MYSLNHHDCSSPWTNHGNLRGPTPKGQTCQEVRPEKGMMVKNPLYKRLYFPGGFRWQSQGAPSYPEIPMNQTLGWLPPSPPSRDSWCLLETDCNLKSDGWNKALRQQDMNHESSWLVQDSRMPNFRTWKHPYISSSGAFAASFREWF